MELNKSEIRQRLHQVLSNLNEYDSAKEQHDIVFHMTDWIDDLKQWVEFCQNPSAMSNDEVEEVLTNFLIHVPNHIAAASKLMLNIPVRDIFEVGATEEPKNI